MVMRSHAGDGITSINTNGFASAKTGASAPIEGNDAEAPFKRNFAARIQQFWGLLISRREGAGIEPRETVVAVSPC